MNDQYLMIMIAEFINKLFLFAIWFSSGWFVSYCILCPWLQIRLCRFKRQDILPREKRLGPVFVSHLLFSILLINPYVLLLLVFNLQDILDSIVSQICFIVIYFLLLPIAFDLLLLRVVSRWKKLRWFQWQHPLKRVLSVSLLLCLIALGAGFLSIQLSKIAPTVVRAFPLRPKSFSWKIDTESKPLIDCSVPAETDRMFADDKYIYIRVNSKNPTWAVVDRVTHTLIKTEPATLAFVLEDHSAGTWQIRQGTQGILCSRIGDDTLKNIPVEISNQATFLEYQVGGLIVGAVPSSGYLFAFDPTTGQVLWKVRAPAAKSNNDRRIGSIAGTDHVVVVGLWTSRVWAVDTKTGRQLWLFKEKGYGNSMHVEASEAGIVGFSRSDKVYSFSPSNGEVKWSKPLGDLAGGQGEGNVCLMGDKVIFRDEATITCVNIESGEIHWKSDFGDHYSGGVSCSNEGIIACTSDRSLVLLNAFSGQKLFQTKFPIKSGVGYGWSNNVQNEPGMIYTHPVVNHSGNVYVFAGDGTLWALKPKL